MRRLSVRAECLPEPPAICTTFKSRETACFSMPSLTLAFIINDLASSHPLFARFRCVGGRLRLLQKVYLTKCLLGSPGLGRLLPVFHYLPSSTTFASGFSRSRYRRSFPSQNIKHSRRLLCWITISFIPHQIENHFLRLHQLCTRSFE